MSRAPWACSPPRTPSASGRRPASTKVKAASVDTHRPPGVGDFMGLSGVVSVFKHISSRFVVVVNVISFIKVILLQCQGTDCLSVE